MNMMNNPTRADIEAAITKLHCAWIIMDDVRQSPAIWQNMESLKDLEIIRDKIEDLQDKLDNSF